MPKNKLASFRYRVINKCLRNTYRNWSAQQLIDEIGNQLYEHFGINKGISMRTFRYDIELMRSLPPRGFDAPIKVNNGIYYYEDHNYSIDYVELSHSDINTINDAITLLKNFPKLSITEELAFVQTKLQRELSKQEIKDNIISFEQKEVKGIEYISELFKYINDKSPVEIIYKPFQSEANEFVVHPYLLKQYNHRWYLIGYSSTYKSVGLYSLDRIVKIKTSEERFIPNTFLEVENYFKDIVGVSLPKGEDIKKIIVRADTKQAQYITTKPIHHSQDIIKETNDHIDFSLELIPNYEFYSQILSYGSSVQILSPIEVRNKIAKMVKELHYFYCD